MYLETQKTFGGPGIWKQRFGYRDCQSAGSRFRPTLAAAVDKKLNPTGYSKLDDEDLPF